VFSGRNPPPSFAVSQSNQSNLEILNPDIAKDASSIRRPIKPNCILVFRIFISPAQEL